MTDVQHLREIERLRKVKKKSKSKSGKIAPDQADQAEQGGGSRRRRATVAEISGVERQESVTSVIVRDDAILRMGLNQLFHTCAGV